MTNQKSGHPDAELHPVATGQAKVTADAHKDVKPLKFYTGWFCPFAQRAWMVLEEKGIPYEYIEVNPYNKPDSLMKLNPRGLVPTLEVHDKPLYESTVICQYLEEAYPGFGPNLNPTDLVERGRMRIWCDWITSRFVPSFFRFLQTQPSSNGGSDEGLENARQEFLGYIKEFTKEMDESGPYFLGAQPYIIDFLMAPWAIRIWAFDDFKGGSGVPAEGQGGDDEKVWARWRKYVQALEERKSVKDTISDKEHFTPIYQRYANNTAQSEMAKATRAGRGVP